MGLVSKNGCQTVDMIITILIIIIKDRKKIHEM